MNDFADPQDNTWHQAVIAYAGSGNRYKAWYDGRVLVDNYGGGELSTCSTGDGSYNVRIGSHSYDEGWAFRGQMDEVAYWDTMLTDGQVTRLYNNGDGLDLLALNSRSGGDCVVHSFCSGSDLEQMVSDPSCCGAQDPLQNGGDPNRWQPTADCLEER